MCGTAVLKMGVPGGSGVRNLPANEGGAGSMPGSGRSHRGENGNLLQDFCLENPMDRGAWRTIVHEVKKSWMQLRDWTTIPKFWKWCVPSPCLSESMMPGPTWRKGPPSLEGPPMMWVRKAGLLICPEPPSRLLPVRFSFMPLRRVLASSWEHWGRPQPFLLPLYLPAWLSEQAHIPQAPTACDHRSLCSLLSQGQTPLEAPSQNLLSSLLSGVPLAKGTGVLFQA